MRGDIFRAALVVVVLLASTATLAGGRAAVRKQIESTMLLAGTIQLDTAGRVSRYTLDKQDQIPPLIVRLVARDVPQWTFRPVEVEGRPVNALARMNLRVVAQKLDDGNFALRIASASFTDAGAQPQDDFRALSMAPPDYPTLAARAGVNGTAYLLVKVGRDGKVADVVTEQVNLKIVAREPQMQAWRDLLASTSMRQARKWTFHPVTQGAAADAPYWVVRVPVVFSLSERIQETPYGAWETYVPGPRLPCPWDEADEGLAFSPDTLAPGAAYRAGAGPRLLTRLSEG